jgi:D-alanyl-D-alanine carboxypeptidase/D-alanyl-D-alanine-endopeptidase (penicillin-binding protein 4)
MKGLILAIAFLSLNSWASDPSTLIAEFKQIMISKKIGTVSEQAFCYQDGANVEGYQVNKLQRLASVTKVLTTYFASETQDLNRTFATKIYITADRLHIEGSRDPYFEEEKMLLLMRAINDLGYKQFKTVTFNKDFIFSDAALSSHMDITPAHTKSRLAYFLSAKSKLSAVWAATRKFAEEEGYTIDATPAPSVSAATIEISDVNPLNKSNPIVYVHTSRPLHAILKSMNVMSKNMVAQHVFLESGRVKTFPTLMTENGIDVASFKIHNGSGLPIKGKNTRVDNLCSCKTILNVISLLQTSLKKHNLELSQVMAVTGRKDLGSFRERFEKYPETDNAVLAKTGTLSVASALAGVMMIHDAIPFAIINHTSSSLSARSAQELVVSRMFHHLGEPTPIEYEKLSIFPVDQPDFLTIQTNSLAFGRTR